MKLLHLYISPEHNFYGHHGLRGKDRERIGAVGQTIVTATGAEALPLAPAQLLRVTPGRIEEG